MYSDLVFIVVKISLLFSSPSLVTLGGVGDYLSNLPWV